MNLIIIWVSFILLISFVEEFNYYSYILFSILMFIFTYVFNRFKPTVISLRIILLLFNIPITVFWYIAFVYNDFLSITPINYETFMSLFFIYTYFILYLFIENPLIKNTRFHL